MDKQRLVELHKEGKTDAEIASIMNVSRQLVQFHRNKLGLSSNFSYSSFRKMNYEEAERLVKDGSSINIATNCFEEDELLLLLGFFKDRFNLTFHINSNHSIYLLKRDFEHFKKLVLPYMRQELLYKLSLNHVNLGKSGDR